MVTTVTPQSAPATSGRAPDQESIPAAGALLVATDGTGSAEPAFIAARLLAHRSGAPVRVVTVVEPVPLSVPGPYQLAATPDMDARRMQALAERAKQQLETLVGIDTGWPVDTWYGDPASTIWREARKRDAELVITGLSRHGIVDRVFGGDTTTQIAARAAAPLLAVHAMDRLPRTIVIATGAETDPIPKSAALMALLSEVTRVHFVNVRSEAVELPGLDPAVWFGDDSADIARARERIKGSLDLPAGAFDEVTRLTGNPARELLDFARKVGADLIVVGRRQHTGLGRLAGAGLAGRLLRAAACSVLVLPRPLVVHGQSQLPRAKDGPRTETLTHRDAWAARLADLSQWAVARRVMLEVDDAELGAQMVATDYPLLGLDYDHRDNRVEIMLGSQTSAAHLTHAVVDPLSIDVLEGADGVPITIRVTNEAGQTLLTFMS